MLKQNHNISVVIPAHNAEKSILKALESLSGQTHKPFEIIVVDDGSIDRTGQIAGLLATKVIRTKKRGPAAARNTGIKHASGQIIALLDSDCQAQNTWIESINRIFSDKEILVVMGKVTIPPSNCIGGAISALGFPAGGAIGFDKVWKVTPQGYTNTLSTCNCAFRKEIFNQFGAFDEDFPYAGGEDTLFAAKIVKAGLKIKYCPEVKVWHEPRASLNSFLKWQVQRGKCAFQFKRKIGAVSGFAKMRLWSTKNVIMSYWNDKKFPLILLLILSSYFLQSLGYLVAYINNLGSAKKHQTTSCSVKEIRDWYDYEYAQNPNRFTRDWESYNRFLDPIKPGKGKKLLDVACGTGGLLKSAKEKGLVPFGLDISREGISLAVQFNGCRKLLVGDAQNLPYKDNSFDYITNIGSLEHFPNPRAGLKEMTRVLKAEGKMCVVLPNSFGLLGKLIRFRGTGQIVERLATFGDWMSFLEKESLRIISVHRDPGPSILHDKKPFKILMRLAAKIILPFLPKSCAYQFIFICQKK